MVNVILKRLNSRYGKNITRLHNSVLRGFHVYAWPGNIRELENVIERAYVLETSPCLTSQHFPVEIVPFKDEEPVAASVPHGTLAEVRQRTVNEVEVKYLAEKLTEHNGRIDRTAADAGITPRQLHKLMSKYGLKRGQFLRKELP
jgi:DNA-binding NtrC family response regulator